MSNPVQEALRIWKIADEAWSAELTRLFKGDAGTVRYTKTGQTGPTLAPLYAEFTRCREAWEAAVQATRINQ